VLDVHLGRLARYLRMLGFDSLYGKSFSDDDLIRLMRSERRTLLTRDQNLLRRNAVTRGYLIRSRVPVRQAAEVILRFDLFKKVQPLSRCLICNTPVAGVAKADIADRLPPKTRNGFDEFRQCPGCRRVYWKGAHTLKMLQTIKHILEEAASPEE